MCERNDQYVEGPALPDLVFHGSKAEQVELVRCVLAHQGTCDCHPAKDMWGKTVVIHVCNSHWFLNERDTNSSGTCVTRVDRLMFARSQRGRWVAGEFGALLTPPEDTLPW